MVVDLYFIFLYPPTTLRNGNFSRKRQVKRRNFLTSLFPCQCLMYLYHYPDIWYDYATWHAKSGSKDSAVKVFQRASKALPGIYLSAERICALNIFSCENNLSIISSCSFLAKLLLLVLFLLYQIILCFFFFSIFINFLLPF